MPTPPIKPTKPEKDTEKKTDATAVLSPDELRAISGGITNQPPPPPKPNGLTVPKAGH